MQASPFIFNDFVAEGVNVRKPRSNYDFIPEVKVGDVELPTIEEPVEAGEGDAVAEKPVENDEVSKPTQTKRSRKG